MPITTSRSGVAVDVGEGGRAEAAVPVVAEGRGQAHAVELVAEVVEDVQVAHAVAPVLGPGGEDHLGVAVVVEIGHHRLAREAEVSPPTPVEGTR